MPRPCHSFEAHTLALPICIELIADPPPQEVFAQALVESCSGAAGPSVCALYPNCQAAAAARVRVRFQTGYARVAVELVSGNGRPDTKEIVFREDDPPLERFRATGLVVAGRVPLQRARRQFTAPASAPASAPTAGDTPSTAFDSADEAPIAAPPPAEQSASIASPSPAAPENEHAPVWSAAAVFDVGFVEPGIGLRFAVDVPIGGNRRLATFVTLSVAHEQTFHGDVNGVAEQHQTLAAGAGLLIPLVERRLTFRVPLQVEVEQLRASVVQPGSGRQDAGRRVLYGLALGADFVWSFSPRFGVFAGALATWTSERTDVLVAGQRVASISPVQLSSAIGLNVRIP